MKKLILFFAVIIIVLSGCKNEDPVKTTLLYYLTIYSNNPEFLNGQIKSVTEKNYWGIEQEGVYVKGKAITAEELNELQWSNDYTAYFDKDGIVTRVDTYTGDQVNSFVTEIENGALVSVIGMVNDSSRYYYTLTLDERGFYKSAQRFRSVVDTLLNSYEYGVNEDGFFTEASIFNYKGENTYTYKYELSADNRVLAMKIFTGDGTQRSERTWEYNDKGFFVSSEFTNLVTSNSSSFSLNYTSYDDMGNWLTAEAILKDKPVIICERTYVYY